MGKRITDREFFERKAEEVAQDLLGKIICRKEDDGFVIKCRITVTEAYPTNDSVNDNERAKKNGKSTVQSLNGGVLYVKKHRDGYRFDIVAGKEGDSESVLIRGLDAYDEGPMISAYALNINCDLNGIDLTSVDSIVWIEDDNSTVIPNEPTKRVLGEKANIESVNKLLRYSIKEIKYN